MDQQPTLSLEQQFDVELFKHQVYSMDESQCKSCLVSTYRSMLEMENNYKELLKHQWNL
ncbi:MAG: NblA/ycf18 family protein [Pelagibacteraceae bacterium]|jgi:hypothetical protein